MCSSKIFSPRIFTSGVVGRLPSKVSPLFHRATLFHTNIRNFNLPSLNRRLDPGFRNEETEGLGMNFWAYARIFHTVAARDCGATEPDSLERNFYRNRMGTSPSVSPGFGPSLSEHDPFKSVTFAGEREKERGHSKCLKYGREIERNPVVTKKKRCIRQWKIR